MTPYRHESETVEVKSFVPFAVGVPAPVRYHCTATDRARFAPHEHHALQCGFCTPGMLLTALDLLGVNPRPTEDEIRQGPCAVLFRCTGYQGIVDAVAAVARGAAP